VEVLEVSRPKVATEVQEMRSKTPQELAVDKLAQTIVGRMRRKNTPEGVEPVLAAKFNSYI
jgi:PBP1b-binding outer membrane lipoprotein LpoB